MARSSTPGHVWPQPIHRVFWRAPPGQRLAKKVTHWDYGALEPLPKILGIPFVYDHVRPWVLGGIDLGRPYELLEVGANDALLDIGCGTGDALKYVSGFARYLGIDTDPVAIASAQARFGDVPNVEFACKMCTASDIQAFKPTCVVMAGLLRHLSDESAFELLNLALKTTGVRRAVTLDIVYLAVPSTGSATPSPRSIAAASAGA